MFEIEHQGQIYHSDQARRPSAPGDSYMDAQEKEIQWAEKVTADQNEDSHALDKPDAIEKHSVLMGHYIRELERQSENRAEMAMDEDFYDHIQWTEEELAVLKARGQAPIVFNMIQTSVNWVLGSQRRATMDYKILPRRKEGLKPAERKTELLKHNRDENRSEYEYAKAFTDAVKAGIGWLETGQASPEDGPIVFDRSESWRNMLWDSTSQRYDLSDARYVARSKWLDLDICRALWPKRKGLLELSATNVSTGIYALDEMGDEPMDSQEIEHFNNEYGRSRFNAERMRVRVIEMWFKMPQADAKIIRGGQFNGELFDGWSVGHHRELIDGRATLVARPREVIMLAIMTDAGLLDLRESPYRHNKFPFTPVWGYRRARDGMPYGIIRGMRDINRDLNKRASKALHHLSTTRVTVTRGAVKDIEELREEAARPDGVIIVEPGFTQPEISTDTNVAAAHVDMMNRDAAMIQAVGGVTDENMGRSTNATSGKAIVARQDQGQLATSMFFDNLRQSRVIHGEKHLVNIEQFYTDEDTFRVTNSRGHADWKPINDGNPDNAISEFKADFIITEEDWRASARQAQAEELLDLMGKLAATAPQLVIKTLDLVIEALDVPKRDELVKRIRQETGVTDPDADPANPDPETIAMMKQKEEAAAMAKRGMDAELGEKEAKTRKTNAEAARAEAGLANDTIAQVKASLEAAIAIAGAPMVARAADQILARAREESGLSMPAPEGLPQMPAGAMPAPAAMPQGGVPL